MPIARQLFMRILSLIEMTCIIAAFILFAAVSFGLFLRDSSDIILKSPDAKIFLTLYICIMLPLWVSISATEVADGWKSNDGRNAAINTAVERLFKIALMSAIVFLISNDIVVSISHIAKRQSFNQVVIVKDMTTEMVPHARRLTRKVSNYSLAAKLPSGDSVEFTTKSGDMKISQLVVDNHIPAALCMTVTTGIFGGYWITPSSLRTKCDAP